MLWLFLQLCGYVFTSSYNATDSLRDRESPNPLDPVSVAGCANMEALKKTLRTWRWKPGLIASEVLDHPSKYMIKPISAQRRVWTKKRYKEHMEHLEKAGILQRLEHPNECSFFSSYFSVPKTSICDRAIFNGKALSTLFKAPPPVNLAQTRDVLTRLQNLAYEHDNLYVAVGDFRHWFHQLSASKKLQQCFGIACCGISYKWKTIPMGWSYSPYIAQVMSWIFLLDGIDDHLAHDFKEETLLPTFIELKSGGFITVYYDNYFCVSPSRLEFDCVQANITRNVEKYGIVIKEHKMFGNEMQPISEGFIFLGLHIRIENREVSWRVDQTKIDALPTKLPLMCTPRRCAGVIGKILASVMPSREPLGFFPGMVQSIEALRRAGHSAFVKHNWDLFFELPGNIVEEVNVAWTNLRINAWRSCKSQRMEGFCILATDASDFGWGVSILSADGLLLKQHKRPWTIAEKELHIFIREVMAAERGLKILQESRFFDPKQKIVLVIDNTAAAWAIRRGYTGNTRAMRSIMQFFGVFHLLDVCTITSEENCADEPSRNKIVRADKVKRTYVVVNKHFGGQRHGTIPIAPPFAGNVRHPEPPDARSNTNLFPTEECLADMVDDVDNVSNEMVIENSMMNLEDVDDDDDKDTQLP